MRRQSAVTVVVLSLVCAVLVSAATYGHGYLLGARDGDVRCANDLSKLTSDLERAVADQQLCHKTETLQGCDLGILILLLHEADGPIEVSPELLTMGEHMVSRDCQQDPAELKQQLHRRSLRSLFPDPVL